MNKIFPQRYSGAIVKSYAKAYVQTYFANIFVLGLKCHLSIPMYVVCVTDIVHPTSE